MSSSPLPIINIDVALSTFYVSAPLLLVALYLLFDIYLQGMWRNLASLPAVFPDGEASDEKTIPVISRADSTLLHLAGLIVIGLLHGLVRAHFKKLELAQRPFSRSETSFPSCLPGGWCRSPSSPSGSASSHGTTGGLRRCTST
jgi:hypothetical protein